MVKARVLIVDDEAGIVQSLQKLFELHGVATAVTTSAREAIQWHRASLFSVILTDIAMPEMSGVEVVRQAREISPTTSLYVMTGFGTMMNLSECLGLGAVDYFMKPFESADELIETVKARLARHDKWLADLSGAHRRKAA